MHTNCDLIDQDYMQHLWQLLVCAHNNIQIKGCIDHFRLPYEQARSLTAVSNALAHYTQKCATIESVTIDLIM